MHTPETTSSPQTPTPAEPSKAQPKHGGGCLRVVGAFGAFGAFVIVYFIWALNVPANAANAFKQRVAVGMKLSDVVVASFEAGRHYVFVDAPEGASALSVGASGVTVAGETIGATLGYTPAMVREFLEPRTVELRVRSLRVLFVGDIPVRASVVIRFGPEGKVTEVEGPSYSAN